MQVKNIRVWHMDRPMGWEVSEPNVSWTVEGAKGKKQEKAKVEILCGGESVFCTEGENLCSTGVSCAVQLSPRTRYDVRVSVWDETGESAVGESWFETGKMNEPWQAQWIAAPFAQREHPVLGAKVQLAGKPARARIYAVGLGAFELYVNGRKAGAEVLTPLYNDYNNWIQTITFDVTELLRPGENELSVMLGEAWYMGQFGFGEGGRCLFGDRMQLLLEGHVEYEEGEETIFGTQPGSWLCTHSPVLSGGIYDGEVLDACAEPGQPVPAVEANAPAGALADRLSPPVKVIERLSNAKLLITPKGERVLDFGQVMTGWVEFDCDLPKGAKVYLQYGELLQEDCFYRENLRSAKAEFTYISDGSRAFVRPHFTFYGFRYVKVVGMDKVDPKAFTACVIHSELEPTGRIETGNAKLDRLIENAYWSQRGNFLDTPTDCPQRDERMGWTGDAQVFAPTACYSMHSPAFYRKYMHDMKLEQRNLQGSVPFVVPDMLSILNKNAQEGIFVYAAGSCAWGDAATVIPWTVYRFYGDKKLLAEQYENMTLWADWIHMQDEGDFLWRKGFHFADWLALDNPVQGSSFGGTDPYYIASVYYYYSTLLCAKAACALGKAEDKKKYAERSEKIKEAIRREFFTATGRIAEPTQTAMALALYFDIVPQEHAARLAQDLRKKLIDKDVHLDTGFVGTYFLLPVLTKIGMHDLAVQLLLNEDYPSWLYEVNMGATTIWERWNSVLPNGYVSDTGMNSMNHYAYGSIVEWIYSTLCGLKPDESAPGFKRAIIAPLTDPRLGGMKCEYASAAGLYKAGWARENGKIHYHIEIPFDAEAVFVPEQADAALTVNGEETKGEQKLAAGVYDIYCAETDVATDYFRLKK
ncbi:MAG: family 78 glycoside hydrolase catalytic domain [Eubacteriales bacterium]|nr:family 78 glycoside hydrolase catalytic domain [Eubacteriales bacterium]